MRLCLLILITLPLLLFPGLPLSTMADETQEEAFGPEPLVRTQLPHLVLEPQEFDWGIVTQGTEYEHLYLMHNTGTGTLKILRVRPGCGCATASSDEVIAPGETGEVRLTVDTSRLRGQVRKSAMIYSNDPEQPRIKIYLGGKIETLIQSVPDEIRLSALAGDSQEIEILLRSGTSESVTIEKIETQFKNLEIGPLVAGDDGYRVKLRMVASPKPTTKRENLRLKIRRADGSLKREEIPVTVEHRDPLEFLPSRRLTFTRQETEKLARPDAPPLEQSVTIRSTEEGGEFHIVGLDLGRLPSGLVSARVETVTEGREYRIVVRIFGRPEGR